MRKIIYIVGITASGKTTGAGELSAFLKIPFCSADRVLEIMARELKYAVPAELIHRSIEKKFDPESIEKIKRAAFAEILSAYKGDLIIEGCSLGYEQERAIIRDIIGDHVPILFYIEPPHDLWRGYVGRKYRSKGNFVDYERWLKMFEPPSFPYYRIKSWDQMIQPYEVYQREGFTDKKFAALKLGDLTGRSIIDIGCNDGQIGRYCLDLGASRVIGIDKNWRNLENARAKGVVPYLAELNDSGWHSDIESANIVLAMSMFHYVHEKGKFIEACSRLCTQEFVLELPISQKDGIAWESYGTKGELLIPTKAAIEDLLDRHFKSFELIGSSPAPDNSTRVVYKGRK